jgi:aspartyl-tRNA(Asn)/glutamyl-tRNA(Gln) amidotransferase subunit A
MRTLRSIISGLSSAQITSCELVDRALARAADGDGEGSRVFISISPAPAMEAARQLDARRKRGDSLPSLAGIPVSVKDLFDIEGEVTRAGSRLRERAAPAERDAPVIERLRRAGAILLGRTNMTEFAFSGLGLNPHFGTPLNPHARASRLIPGGSSSGAAVSVTDQMAAAAVGTDTGGSVRIPAALCGLTGYKPTARTVPTEGVFPLSRTLDSVGPLGWTVDCCARLHAVLAGMDPPSLNALSPRRMRLGTVRNFYTDGMDETVAACYDLALRRLRDAGVRFETVDFPELHDIARINRNGGISAYESFAIHRDTLRQHEPEYDPFVLRRIRRGALIDDAEYSELLRARALSAERLRDLIAGHGLDALIAPTVPIIAPPLAACLEHEEATRLNQLLLRNTAGVNFMDGCAISMPCQREGDPPVGLMLIQGSGRDEPLLAAARAVESVLRPGTGV